MTATAAQREGAHAARTLDAATTQAVIELRNAIRSVRKLERVILGNLSPTQQKLHVQKLERAKWGFREARLGLERLLEEDS